MMALFSLPLFKDKQSDLSSSVPVSFLISSMNHLRDMTRVSKGKGAVFLLIEVLKVLPSLGQKIASLLGSFRLLKMTADNLLEISFLFLTWLSASQRCFEPALLHLPAVSVSWSEHLG